MFQFPIGVIVFDEHELISFVSQGLTLSTASLVGSTNLRPVTMLILCVLLARVVPYVKMCKIL